MDLASLFKGLMVKAVNYLKERFSFSKAVPGHFQTISFSLAGIQLAHTTVSVISINIYTKESYNLKNNRNIRVSHLLDEV